MYTRSILFIFTLLALLGANSAVGNDLKPQRMKDYKKRIAQLTPLQRDVTQRAATEPPYRNEYYNLFEEGNYQCIVCGAQLFDSESKFDSGCGWPAFSAADTAKITMHEDLSFGMRRIEVRCATCGAHLGHLFYDGPTPSGERYCINSASLHFVPKEGAVR